MGQGSGVAMSCGVGRRRGSDPALLWLWCRPAVAAPIRPLAWEPPYAADAAPKRQKTKKMKEKNFLSAFSIAPTHPTNLLPSIYNDDYYKNVYQDKLIGVPIVAQWKQIQLGTMRLRV